MERSLDEVRLDEEKARRRGQREGSFEALVRRHARSRMVIALIIIKAITDATVFLTDPWAATAITDGWDER